MWSDEIVDRLTTRKITLESSKNIQCINATNKTIMDIVTEHLKSKDLCEKLIAPLNYARLCKWMILLCELASLIGKKKAKSWSRVMERSSV